MRSLSEDYQRVESAIRLLRRVRPKTNIVIVGDTALPMQIVAKGPSEKSKHELRDFIACTKGKSPTQIVSLIWHGRLPESLARATFCWLQAPPELERCAKMTAPR